MQGNDSRLGSASSLSWTPVPMFGGVADDGTYVVSNNKYNNISAKVYEGMAVITWTAEGTKVGNFSIGGIPVTPATSAVAMPVGQVRPFSMSGLTAGGALQLVSQTSSFVISVQTTTGTVEINDTNFTSTTSLRITWRLTIATYRDW